MDLSKLPTWLLSAAAFFIALSAFWVFVFPGRGIEWNAAYYGPYRYNSEVIAGRWDGSNLSNVSNGAKLKARVISPGIIRIEFEAYNFSAPPIVLVNSDRATYATVESATTQYVDIREKAFTGGKLDGPDVTDRVLYFQIMPSTKFK